MADSPRSLGDDRTQAGLSPEPSIVRSLGDQSTHAEEVSSVSDLGALAANLDETLELTDLSARYELGAVIGRGGMGEVLLARDKRLERSVAIKRILGEDARSATALRRFLTEARSLAQLNHFNVVQVFDYGRDTQGPFLILEYVAGKSLQERLKDGPLPAEQAVDLACQLCDGLGAAHERGIIHRDVKPANVLLTERGEPKLTDFGLAHRESGDDGRTQAGAVLGTIDFMPPEQRRDATQADARSDLWSLAATLYQMLTGKSPKVIRLDQVPESLRTVLGKALEEEPAQRYASTAEFKEALRLAAEQLRRAASSEKSQELVEGVCPQCGTENDHSRKFCKSCRAALTVECLNCKTPTKVWEDVCGECGTSQREETEQIRAACERQLEEAGSLGRQYQFDDALQLCTAVHNEKPKFLTYLKERATQLAAELNARQAEQLSLRTAIFANARMYFQAARYEAAITELSKIPEPLCNKEVQELRDESGRRVVELSSLLSKIKRRLANKELNDLEVLTERVLQLQPGLQQIDKLHQQLLKRATRFPNRKDATADQWIDDAEKPKMEHYIAASSNQTISMYAASEHVARQSAVEQVRPSLPKSEDDEPYHQYFNRQQGVFFPDTWGRNAPQPVSPKCLIADCQRLIAPQHFNARFLNPWMRTRILSNLKSLERWAFFYPEYRNEYICLWNTFASEVNTSKIDASHFENQDNMRRLAASSVARAIHDQQEPPRDVPIYRNQSSLSSTRFSEAICGMYVILRLLARFLFGR